VNAIPIPCARSGQRRKPKRFGLQALHAKIDQCLLGKSIRIGLAGLGEFNHLLGDDLVKPVVPVDNAKGGADVFVREAHGSYRARIEFEIT